MPLWEAPVPTGQLGHIRTLADPEPVSNSASSQGLWTATATASWKWSQLTLSCPWLLVRMFIMVT